MDASFGYWLSGFVDGEGHFGVYENKCSPGALPVAEFRIKLREDDKAILEFIQETLQIGRIHPVRYLKYADQIVFVVTRRWDLLQIVRLFDKFLLKSKKQRDYEIWRQAVIELNRPFPDKDYLLKLAERIKEVRKYNAK